MKEFYPLFLLMVLVSSCNGQTETTKSVDIESDPKISTVGNPTIVKPAGTHPFTNIRCSLQDKAGNLWFGTTGAGVYRYDGKTFTNFSASEGLCSNVVYCILEDRSGNIWVGTNNGVCFYDGKVFSPLPIPGIDGATYNPFYGALALSNSAGRLAQAKSILTMVKDYRGNIWLGTGATGLYRYDGAFFTNFRFRDSTWQIIPNDDKRTNDSLNENAVQCMLADDDGGIWFSALGHAGVYRYDGHAFAHFADTKVFGSDVEGMLQDNIGRIWFSTWEDGLIQYDWRTFKKFLQKDGLCDNFTSFMMQDSKGTIWFGGSQKDEAGRKKGCLTRYDGKSFTRFPLDGLANTSIWNILEDRDGNIWLGSRNVGLYRYDGKSFTDFSEK